MSLVLPQLLLLVAICASASIHERSYDASQAVPWTNPNRQLISRSSPTSHVTMRQFPSKKRACKMPPFRPMIEKWRKKIGNRDWRSLALKQPVASRFSNPMVTNKAVLLPQPFWDNFQRKGYSALYSIDQNPYRASNDLYLKKMMQQLSILDELEYIVGKLKRKAYMETGRLPKRINGLPKLHHPCKSSSPEVSALTGSANPSQKASSNVNPLPLPLFSWPNGYGMRYPTPTVSIERDGDKTHTISKYELDDGTKVYTDETIDSSGKVQYYNQMVEGPYESKSTTHIDLNGSSPKSGVMKNMIFGDLLEAARLFFS
ncbi:uncharacterized protein LOC136028312 isoform X2 [Artemia franciscana]|uniref:Uncharacterized protein n=1 Tax=Artemia franciscana TaxID=6661 RepID=A0AA88HGA8_ARTSF|nr:hypothetical protein QYM36_014125 [Artemia franciscana]